MIWDSALIKLLAEHVNIACVLAMLLLHVFDHYASFKCAFT